MKLAQYKGHTYDIPHIKDYFGYKTDYFKNYGCTPDDIEMGPSIITNYHGFKITTFSDYDNMGGFDFDDSTWFNPNFANVPVAGHTCTVYHNYMDKDIPGSTDDEDPEYMIEYYYLVDDATDEIVWIHCLSEE